MSVTTLDGYDLFRNDTNTDKVWNLREIFLRAHHGKFDDDKLICLSYCFINHELYGCRYPRNVMQLLDQLTTGLPEVARLRDLKKSENEVKFVRASENQVEDPIPDDLTEVKFIQASTSTSNTYASLPGKKIIMPQMSFVKARTSYQSTDVALQSLGGIKPGSQIQPPSLDVIDFSATQSETAVESLIAKELKLIRLRESNSRYLDDAIQQIPDSLFKPSTHKLADSANLPGGTKRTICKVSPCSLQNSVPLPPSKCARLNFGTATHSRNGSSHNCANKSKEEQKFHDLFQRLQLIHADNNISRLQKALDKVSMVTNHALHETSSRSQRVFNCELLLDFISVSIGKGTNKKLAKHNAYDLAVGKILQGEFRVIQKENGHKVLETSAMPIKTKNVGAVEDIGEEERCDQSSSGVVPQRQSVIKVQPSMHQDRKPSNRLLAPSQPEPTRQEKLAGKRKHASQNCESHNCGDLSNFLILEHKGDDSNPGSQSAVCVLHRSADFNKMPLSYEYVRIDEEVRCNLSINGMSVFECVGPSRADVKATVSEKALEKLRQICYTITIKQHIDGAERSKLSRKEVMGNIAKHSEVIPDSNIGSKMLRKMGWIGGGIGKDGSKGISEPVKAGPMIINREGLEASSEKGVGSDFREVIHETLLNYAKSKKGGDIAFSSEFSKEERVMIHKQCTLLGLKGHSHGKGHNRYLVVSRKRDAAQLFSHIMKSGGQTEKYEITEPSRKQM